MREIPHQDDNCHVECAKLLITQTDTVVDWTTTDFLTLD